MAVKLILAILVLAASVGVAFADWLACDIPDPSQDVVKYGVTVNSDPEVEVAYQENSDNSVVLLWDIALIPTATFKVVAINSQGRRSEVTDPFVLKPKPSKSTGHTVVED